MRYKFNVNGQVKVKLTEEGIRVLKERHDELNQSIRARGGKGLGEFQLHLDDDGYYSTQMWILMGIFGGYMAVSTRMVFEAGIILVGGEPV